MPLRFPGQYADAESGTNYNYYRDYDPSLGRYIQSDPIGLYGGFNTYTYVNSDPINYSDPSGLCPAGGILCAAGVMTVAYLSSNVPDAATSAFIGGTAEFLKPNSTSESVVASGAKDAFIALVLPGTQSLNPAKLATVPAISGMLFDNEIDPFKMTAAIPAGVLLNRSSHVMGALRYTPLQIAITTGSLEVGLTYLNDQTIDIMRNQYIEKGSSCEPSMFR